MSVIFISYCHGTQSYIGNTCVYIEKMTVYYIILLTIVLLN